MGFDTFSEPILRLVFWTGVAVLGMSGVMLVGVIVSRARVVAEERHRKAFLDAWRPVFASHTTEDPLPFPDGTTSIAKRDLLPWLSSWVYYHESIRGEGKDCLNQLALKMGVDRAARRLAARGNLRERLLGVTALGHLRDRESWERLLVLSGNENPTLSLAAARALVLIDAERAIPSIALLVRERGDWSPPKVAAILLEAGSSVVAGPLSQAALQAEPDEAGRILRYLSGTRNPVALPTARRLLEGAEDEELIATALRTLAEFSHPTDLLLVRKYLDHPAWPVRVQAINALGKLAGPEDVERLSALLEDPEWWVRYRAAKALASLPFVSPDLLRGLEERSEDGYARDILHQVLEERRIEQCR